MKRREERKAELESLPRNLVAEIYIHTNAQKTGHLRWPPAGLTAREVIALILQMEYPESESSES